MRPTFTGRRRLTAGMGLSAVEYQGADGRASRWPEVPKVIPVTIGGAGGANASNTRCGRRRPVKVMA